MVTFSQEQLLDRWDHLPMVLREAMYSPEVSGTLWRVCENEHLHDDKTHVVARIVGFAFMGLLTPAQIAREVADELGIDIRIATSIASAINQQIFAPFQGDIDRVYTLHPQEISVSKIIQEIRPVIKTATTAPVSLPSISSPSLLTPTAMPSAPKQAPPKIDSGKTPTVDEFARLNKNVSSLGGAPIGMAVPKDMPSAVPSAKPVLLQTESIPRPILNAPNFRVPASAENVMSGRQTSGSLPMSSAVVEFGGAPIPKAPTPQSSAIPKVTVVRYGNEKSAPSITPPKPEPMRTITEITPETLKTVIPSPKLPLQPSFTPLSQIPVPSIPKPPTTSMPTPPTPPSPLKSAPQMPKPVSQPEKVIQKDYSGEIK